MDVRGFGPLANHLGHQVEAFLIGQAADHRHQRLSLDRRQADFLLQCRFAGSLAGREVVEAVVVAAVAGAFKWGSVSGFQTL